MSNSSLICFTMISPNKTSPRSKKIDTITIHCMAGQLSVESCGKSFSNPSRKASSNYGIGSDGRIGMYVEEKDRSWCSSNSANDNRAVTIEVASDSKHPYRVSDAAYKSLIALCTDICKRNGIKKLVWSNNKSDRIGHKNGVNMTVHRDFANKACPGDYLYSLHGQIAEEVNSQLGSAANWQRPAAESQDTVNKKVYRVRKSADDSASQLGAFSNISNAKKLADENHGYSVFDEKGAKVYPDELANPCVKPYTVMITAQELNVRSGPGNQFYVVTRVRKGELYTIKSEIQNGKHKWGELKSGAGWICLTYTRTK